MKYRGAPLNSGGDRFGGGWTYKLGIDVGGSTVILNLIYGMIRITTHKASVREALETKRAEPKPKPVTDDPLPF